MDEIGLITEIRHRSFLFEWRIEDFLVILRTQFGCRNSPTFKFLNELWYLSISLGHDGCLCLDLMRKDPDYKLDTTVCCTLGLIGADGALYKSKGANARFTLSRRGFVGSRLVTRDRLERQNRKLCPNGVITLYCELRLDEDNKSQPNTQPQTLPHDGNATTLVQHFLDLYLEQKLCDVAIIVGGRKFQAHRSILAARSTVFDAMFEHNMQEKITGIVKIDDCDPHAFHHFLLFLYGAKVDIISPEDAIALYCIADKYDLSQLTSSCENFLLNNLSVELFCDVLVLAMKYEESRLIKAAEDFFAKHFEEISRTIKWQQFLKDNNVFATELFVKCRQNIIPITID